MKTLKASTEQEKDIESNFIGKHCLIWMTEITEIPFEGKIIETINEMDEYMYLIEFINIKGERNTPIWVKTDLVTGIQIFQNKNKIKKVK